jgi:hypothetical protein
VAAVGAEFFFAGQAVKSARQSPRAMIRSEHRFSNATSQGSTILDCGEPFRL